MPRTFLVSRLLQSSKLKLMSSELKQRLQIVAAVAHSVKVGSQSFGTVASSQKRSLFQVSLDFRTTQLWTIEVDAPLLEKSRIRHWISIWTFWMTLRANTILSRILRWGNSRKTSINLNLMGTKVMNHQVDLLLSPPKNSVHMWHCHTAPRKWVCTAEGCVIFYRKKEKCMDGCSIFIRYKYTPLW